MADQARIRKSLVGYLASPATTPATRDNKPGWHAEHDKFVEIAKSSNANVLLIGDSIIQGLSRYAKIWTKYFTPLKALNFGIGGERTQNVLWRVENGEIPLNAQMIVIHVGTNNTDRDDPKDIANGIGATAMMFQESKPNAKMILAGLLPRDLQPSHRRKQVSKVNKYLKRLCQSGHIRNFFYLKPDDDWVLPDGTLDTKYYFHDHLHLVEEGDDKFAKSISDMVMLVYSGGKPVYSSDSDVSDAEANDSYTFERKNDRERSSSPAGGPDRKKSRSRSRSRSLSRRRSKSPRHSRSRSRSPRRRHSRSPRRRSRSPRRRSRSPRRYSRSPVRRRRRDRKPRSSSYSRSPSRSPPRRRRRRSYSRSPSRSPRRRRYGSLSRMLSFLFTPLRVLVEDRCFHCLEVKCYYWDTE